MWRQLEALTEEQESHDLGLDLGEMVVLRWAGWSSASCGKEKKEAILRAEGGIGLHFLHKATERLRRTFSEIRKTHEGTNVGREEPKEALI